MSFVNLHAHSEASIADGLFHPKKWVEALKQRGFVGHAMTDHGSMASLLAFYKLMKAEKMIPILGVEFYFVPDPSERTADNRKNSHLILLAKDYEGFRNLCRLSKLSYTEGYYYKPRIGYEWLAKYSEGLICLTACQGGVLSNEVWSELKGRKHDLVGTFHKLKAIFNDDLYVEFQGHNTISKNDDGELFNSQALINLSFYETLRNEIGFKQIVTNDCHYILPEHAQIQQTLKNISWGSAAGGASDSATVTKDHFTDSLWLKSAVQVYSSFREHHEYLPKQFVADGMRRTTEVLEKCKDFEMPKDKRYLPQFRSVGGATSSELFKRICFKKLDDFLKSDLMRTDKETYIQRFKKEYKVITKYHLEDYFLIVWDVVRFAKRSGIVTGLGRGCLHPDVNVLTADGFKAISKIETDDLVVNRGGEFKRVEAVHKYKHKGRMIRVKSRFGLTSGNAFTPDHKILAIETKKNSNDTYIDISEPKWIRADEVRRGHRVFTPNLESRMDNKELSDDILWLLGYWAGDGWLCEHKRVVRSNGWRSSTGFRLGFAFNNTSKKDFLDKARGILESLGLNPRVCRSKKKNLVQVNVNDKTFYNRISSYFPDYEISSQTKTLPIFFRELSERQAKILLSGLIDSDGSVRGKTTICTTSPRLAYETKELCLMSGILSSIRHESKRIDKRGYNPSAAYYLILDKAESSTVKKDKNGSWSLVIDTETEDYEGDVYDLSVSGKEHNFLTDSFLVHNSAAGCFISYLLDIVKIDPLEHKLIFERFLNENRCETGELPDIDLDFESDRRREIKDYIYKTYGHDRVCEIGTYGRMKLKTALIDFAKSMGVATQREIHAITTNLDLDKEDVDDLVAASESDPRLKMLLANEKFGFAVSEIIGQVKSQGVHPAGVIICSEPIAEITPIKTQKKNFKPGEIPEGVKKKDAEQRVITTQSEDKYIIAQGMMKADILGVKEYDVIRYVIENIDSDLTIDNYVHVIMQKERDKPNKVVWKMFQEGRTEGVFQFSSDGMRALLVMMRPTHIGDLTAANALYRPGCLENGWHIQYCKRKHGEEEVLFVHPSVEEALGDTFGVIVFQEQFMEVIHKLGDVSLVDADTIRSALGKKDKDKLNKFKEEFVVGASKRIGKLDAIMLWDQIEKASGYSFNRSHSAAYAVLAYISQYLKTYYPAHFWAARLDWDVRKNDLDEMLVNRRAASDMGIEFILPHVNRSRERFYVDGSEVVWSFLSVKGVGPKAAKAIVESQPYANFDDFYARVNKKAVKKNNIEFLIFGGAFDEFGDRRDLLRCLESKKKSKKGYVSKPEKELMRAFYDSMGFFELKIKKVMPVFSKYCITEKELHEYTGGEYVVVGGMITAVRSIKTKRDEHMGFVTLMDLDEIIEVTIFPKVWAKEREILRIDNIVQISGNKSTYNNKNNHIEAHKIELM